MDDLARIEGEVMTDHDPRLEDELRETRDELDRVLCCHGRPIECLECGEEYAAELNKPRHLDDNRRLRKELAEARQQVAQAEAALKSEREQHHAIQAWVKALKEPIV